jgi:hypothetical protein
MNPLSKTEVSEIGFGGPNFPKNADDQRGSLNPNAILTEVNVVSIRARWAHRASVPVTQVQLAREHGVSPRTIRSILTRETWKHVVD